MDSVEKEEELIVNWLALDAIKKQYAEGTIIEVSEAVTTKLLTNLMYCIKILEQVRPPKEYTITHIATLDTRGENHVE